MIKYPLSLILPNYTSSDTNINGEFGEFFVDIERKNELSKLRFNYLSSSPSYYPSLNSLRQSTVPVVLSANTKLYSTIRTDNNIDYKPRPIEYNVLSITSPILPLNNNNELVYLEYDVDKSALPDYDEASFYKRPLSSASISQWLSSETNIDDDIVDELVDALLYGSTWLNWFNKGVFEGNRIKTYNVWPMMAPEVIEDIVSSAMSSETSAETSAYNDFVPIVTTPYVWHEKTSFDVVVSCNIDAFSSLPIAVPKGKVKDYSITNKPAGGLSDDLTIEWSAYDKDGWTWERINATNTGSSSAGSTYGVESQCYYNNLDCKSNLAMLNLRFGNANRPLINYKALESILSTQYNNLTPPFGGWEIYNNTGLQFNSLLNQTFSYKVPYRLDGVATDDGYIDNPNIGKPHYQINSQIPAEYNEGTFSLSDVIVGGTFLYPIKDDYSGNFDRYIPVTNYELLTNGNGETLMMTGDYRGTYNTGFGFNIKLNQSALSDDYTTILDTPVLTQRDIPLNYTGSTFRLRDLIARPEPKRWYIVLWINPTGHNTIGYQPTTDTYDYIESLIGTHPGYGHELTILYADSGRNFPFVPVLFKSKTLSRRLPTLANMTNTQQLEPLEFEFDSVLSNVCDNVVNNINICIPFNESRISTPDAVFYDVAADIAKKIKFSVYAKQINTSAGFSAGFDGSFESHSSNAKARFTGTLLEK